MEKKHPGSKALLLGVAMLPLLASCSLFQSDTGSAPQDAKVSFAFGLNRDQNGLAASVDAASDPTSADYGNYGTVDTISSQFGASAGAAESATNTLKAAGFDGAVDATGGLVVGTFSVADAQTFFGVPLNLVGDSGSQRITPGRTIKVPSSVSDSVSEVFGGYASVPVTVSPSPSPNKVPACPSDEGPAVGIRDKLAGVYGLTPLVKDGMSGKEIRIGLLEIDTYSAEAIRLFAKCFDSTMPQVQVTSANATAGQLKQTNDESSLDVVSLGLFAPGLDAIEITQFDGNTSMIFPLVSVMDRQKDPTKALHLLSTSTAFCGTDLTDDELKMSEWLLMSAAATGLTTLASSGDTGSTGCYPNSKDVAVQYPSESPYAISVGGTELSGSGTTAAQAVWNQSPGQELAGGGGPSGSFPRPKYQSGTGLSEQNRQTPDVAFLADPSDVGPIAVCSPGQSCEFKVVAGTSATAPGVAGGLSLILEQQIKNGGQSRLGFLNPAIYQLAQGQKGEGIFADITKGNNDLFNVGCCTAAKGYDMASGWGSFDFAELGKALTILQSEVEQG